MLKEKKQGYISNQPTRIRNSSTALLLVTKNEDGDTKRGTKRGISALDSISTVPSYQDRGKTQPAVSEENLCKSILLSKILCDIIKVTLGLEPTSVWEAPNK